MSVEAQSGRGFGAPPTRVLLRFSTAAWRASPPAALTQVLLMVLQGLIPAAMLWAGRGLVNAIAAIVKTPGPHGAGALGPLLPWALALAALSAAASLGHTVEWVLIGALKPRIQLALERQILHAAVSIPLAQFEQPDLHDRLQRAREALGYRMTNLMLQLAESAQGVVTLLAYGTVLWLASPWLTLVVLLPAAPSAWLKVRAAQSGYIHDYDATPVRRMMAYVRGLILGSSSGQEMRVFRLATHFKERWTTSHAAWWRESLAKAWTEETSSLATTVVQVAAYTAAIAILCIGGLPPWLRAA